jgi:hypothetical protein
MTLDALWQEYKTLEFSARQSFYDERIFPMLLEGFQPTVNLRHVASIHTLGTSYEPVVLAARALHAPRVIVLHTRETSGLLSKVTGWLSGQTLLSFEVERANAESVYQAVLSGLHDTVGAVAFELTSGTKAMVAALAMSAAQQSRSGRDVDVFYIENDAWDAEVRRPKPGGERLVQLRLPPM